MRRIILVFFLCALTTVSCTKEYSLTVNVSPAEAGEVVPNSGTFKDGRSVVLTAFPSQEYEFDSWSGDANGITNPIEVVMSSDKSITANFRLKRYELNLTTSGNGTIQQTLIGTGKNTDYDSGSVVRLEAIPDNGYYFTGWSGDLSGDQNPKEITIDRPKNVVANFEKRSYPLEIVITGEGTVSEQIIITGKSTDYLFGTTVELTATPEEGHDFIEWAGDVISNENPVRLEIDQEKLVKAKFEFELFNAGVGKWKIRKKEVTQRSSFEVYSIEFDSSYNFKLDYSGGRISGQYDIISNSEIVLIDIGVISNIDIKNNTISFSLNISGLFQFDVEGEQDENYQEGRVFIPLSEFEQRLSSIGVDDIIDGYAAISAIQSVTTLDLSSLGVSGQEDVLFELLSEFPSLSELNLSSNNLSQLSLINLSGLSSLNISNNNFSQLDLSYFTALTSLDLTGNPNLECVKVTQEILNSIPSGWTYPSQDIFSLECNCPELSRTSGLANQTLCDGIDPMEPVVFSYGGENVTISINQSDLPTGVSAVTTSNTVTISGTPQFGGVDSYSIVVTTQEGNENCNQVLQTIVLERNEETPIIEYQGSLNEEVTQGDQISPITFTFGGSATGIEFSGFPDGITASLNNETYTISGQILASVQPGSYEIIATTINTGGCGSAQLVINLTVTAPVQNTDNGTSNTTNQSTNEANTETSPTDNTSNSSNDSGSANENNEASQSNDQISNSTEDDSVSTYWRGPYITFSKADNTNPTEESAQDRLTDNVWITRGNNGGQIFNIVLNDAAIKNESPVGTQWAKGTIDQVENLSFGNFRSTVGNPKNVVGEELVLYLVEDDIYLSIKFTSWSQGKLGGFSYERSTPD